MPPFGPLALLAVGVALLIGGAEVFTHAAVESARALRVTVLAMGLLLAGAEPEELFTAAIASSKGAYGIALGDIVGTNITIIALALALGAVLMPIRVERTSRRHGLATLAASLPATLLLLLGRVERWGGLALALTYGLYVGYILKVERIPLEVEELSTTELEAKLAQKARGPAWRSLGLCLVSLAMMGAGGNFTVDGARGLAAWLGLSETIIGLTVVALATSAEMVALSIVPVLKGHPELTVGAILGSYAYNSTLTLGAAALVSPLPVPPEILVFPLPLMLGLLALLVLLMRRGVLGRREGLVLLCLYALHLYYNYSAAGLPVGGPSLWGGTAF